MKQKMRFESPVLVACGDCDKRMSFTIWQFGPVDFQTWIYPESMGNPSNVDALEAKYDGSANVLSDTSTSITGCFAYICDTVNMAHLKEARQQRMKRTRKAPPATI